MKPQSVLDELLRRIERADAELHDIRQVEMRWEELPSRSDPKALDLMAGWMRLQVERTGASGLVFGASGGVDSTLVAILCARALPTRCSALVMPCRSNPDDEADARALLDLLKIPYRVAPLEAAVDVLTGVMGDTATSVPTSLSGNLATRLRGALLYYEANRTGRLVVGTGNIDETYIGYSSKGTASDLFPITGLHKEEVRALVLAGLKKLDARMARKLSRRVASPGYFIGHEAEKELGLSFARIGAALDVIIGQCHIDNTGIHPRSTKAFLAALKRSKVPGQDLLDVAALIMRNHHKTFGSPALWRPEPLLTSAQE